MASTPVTSMKDARLAAVAQILEKKKLNINSDHKPVIGGSTS